MQMSNVFILDYSKTGLRPASCLRCKANGFFFSQHFPPLIQNVHNPKRIKNIVCSVKQKSPNKEWKNGRTVRVFSVEDEPTQMVLGQRED